MIKRIKHTAAALLLSAACIGGVSAAFGEVISIDMGRMKQELSQFEELYNAQQYDQALPIVTRLAANGHVNAAYFTGLMHHRGRGTPVNGMEAARWYHQAARAGHAAAACNLGVILMEGTGGLKPNDVEGLAWLERSAVLGNVPGQLAYGAALINSNPAPAQFIDGCAWMLIAAEAGNEIAKQNLQTLKVDNDQVKQVQDRAQAMRKLMETEHQRLGEPPTVQVGDSEVGGEDYPDRGGAYRGDTHVVVLRHGPRGANQLYLGELRQGESRFPLRGRHANGRITGEYQTGPNQWQPFVLTFGEAITLTANGADHRLERQ